jgi:hypothetical protein
VYALGVVDDREVVEESVHVGDGGGAGVCLESTFEGLVESFDLSMGMRVARVPVLLGDAEACEYSFEVVVAVGELVRVDRSVSGAREPKLDPTQHRPGH